MKDKSSRVLFQDPTFSLTKSNTLFILKVETQKEGGNLTPLSKKIFEEYQVRKTKKQKLAFIALMKGYFPELVVQEGGFPHCRNIIVGDVKGAKLILSAHYDTCARLPFPNFIAPKNPLLSILYSVLLVVPMVLVIFLINLLLSFVTADYWIHYFTSLACYFLLFAAMIAGPANKHTANDNTSGVIALCELLSTLAVDERCKVAFVFFDHEETGLIGSSLFRKLHKKEIRDKLLINLDCISDGDNILVTASKAARKEHAELLKKSFLPTENKTILFTKSESTYYPSDQMGFKKSVAIAALKHKRFIGYYMDRIHTKADTVFDKENIKLICQSILTLIKNLA